jgi:hypothetical protein
LQAEASSIQLHHDPALCEAENLLYTGVTRAKRLVVLVGQKKAVAIAVRNISDRRRWSKLGEWLHTVQARPDEAVGRLPQKRNDYMRWQGLPLFGDH